jgi:hypothetical protein
MSLAYWLHSAWMLASLPSSLAFHRATRRVANTQTTLLRQCLHDNRGTEIGRRHRFAEIPGPQQYAERVPLATYEEFADAVGRIARGERGVLTRETVTLLEPTSGSTGGEKLIPYTAGLQRQFQNAIGPWIANLLWQRPGLRNGRAYWSISPAFGKRRLTSGGIPIGFEDDTAYLGVFERLAAARVLAAPSSLARSVDLETFRYQTLLHLLRADDLTLISIWNPTFLTALLRPLDGWHERLCHDLRATDAQRADAIERIWRNGGAHSDRLRALWPRLQLISCWTDAGAAAHLPEVSALFPHVEIQPKGLIATEAFVSLPLLDRPGAALAIRSHFFEFEESDGAIRCAHEVEHGGRYRVIVTTAGGLYRYQLRDEVEIAGFLNECPLLRFLGKADLISDLVGEKLAEPFVRQALDTLGRAVGIRPKFALLTPVRGTPPHYRLYVQGEIDTIAWQSKLQQALEENPHYRYACGLGQLGAVEIVALDHDDPWQLYERGCLARGQKLGNIKPIALDPRPGWEETFQSALATSDHG